MYGLILIPAQGRNYDHADQCKADWDGGKDFLILDGPLCSCRDKGIMQQAGFDHITFTACGGKPVLELSLV